ncbi:MAG: DUF1854 domain-containing protein [Ruminococcaceae bacterium]|nr:DUF1854 domain-containing protein [Oscillospiraceae bacterium]
MLKYIEGPEVKLTVNDKIFIDAEFYGSDEKLYELEPHRLFPISGLNKYISLLDSEGNERAIIRNIDNLLPESKAALQSALDEYYMIPKITRFVKRYEKFSIWMWTVDTDKGRYTFELRNSLTAIKTLYDGRILIKDGSDNRYEITDLYKLDKRSIKMMLPDI